MKILFLPAVVGPTADDMVDVFLLDAFKRNITLCLFANIKKFIEFYMTESNTKMWLLKIVADIEKSSHYSVMC